MVMVMASHWGRSVFMMLWHMGLGMLSPNSAPGSLDILGAMVDANKDGQVNEDIWKLAEDAWLSWDASRSMNRPSADGSSRDHHYSALYTGTSECSLYWNI
jgi:hypothetical protein